jgi:RNA polymerase sigma-70 factor (ECF subfamily)
MNSEDDDPASEFIREITSAQPDIGAYVRSLLPTAQDYMDILQEVNLTLWKKKDSYRLGTNFKAWAFSIARYQVMTARRKYAVAGKRLVFTEEVTELLAETAPFHEDESNRRFAALHHCLDELGAPQRELLRARYSSDMSIEDYARRHRKNPGTLRAILRRLRLILLSCVEGKMKTPQSSEFTP